MNTLRILNFRGDETVTFDPTDERTLTVARERFAALVGRGYIAYRLPAVDAGTGVRGAEVIRDFDPEARETILAPQLQGG